MTDKRRQRDELLNNIFGMLPLPIFFVCVVVFHPEASALRQVLVGIPMAIVILLCWTFPFPFRERLARYDQEQRQERASAERRWRVAHGARIGQRDRERRRAAHRRDLEEASFE
jgi:hypothetical protein